MLFDPLLQRLRPDPWSAQHLWANAEDLSPEVWFRIGEHEYNNKAMNQAEAWWNLAADAGVDGAMFYLGLMYRASGRLDEAEDWYTRAAEAGEPSAMQNLAIMQ